jgi:magnesium transporter
MAWKRKGAPIMLRLYSRMNQHLVAESIDAESFAAAPTAANLVWADLLAPTHVEARFVEQLLKIELPSKEAMQEIEFSARLYTESDAQFMTVMALSELDTDEPLATPITFILRGQYLATVRYAEPKPFATFGARVQRVSNVACQTGELVMLGLLETLTDRLADALERVGTDIDGISRDVFRKKDKASAKNRDLQNIIEQIGRKGDLLNLVSESLVSFYRLLTYHSAIESERARKEARGKLKLLQRDLGSLREHASYLSSKVNFLLDATLGLINLEQNQIIKIFSVAAVAFLPPTLVASIYGMNFQYMPELNWVAGYPWALGLMLLSAILPYFYFKRRGWL